MADEVHKLLNLRVAHWEVQMLVQLCLDVLGIDHVLLVLVEKSEAVAGFFVPAALLRALDVVLAVCDHLLSESEVDTVPGVVLVKELSIEALELFAGFPRRHSVVAKVMHNIAELGKRDKPVVVRIVELKCLGKIVH